MVSRKTITQKKEKSLKVLRKKKINIDLTPLTDVIVEGKLIAKLKSSVVFERTTTSKTEIHIGTIEKFDENDGILTIWDETKEQYYLLNVNQTLPKLKQMV